MTTPPPTSNKPLTSPFFAPAPSTTANMLAILHLRRDTLVPVTLTDSQTAVDGYAEGTVTNTRFGSFPHSTLLGCEWGSQVRASKVDTGTRGRKGKGQGTATTKETLTENGATAADEKQQPPAKRPASDAGEVHPDSPPTKKAKAQAPTSPSPSTIPPPKPATTASTGFVHILPPTPETWTASLDHRTQVVYTPDYSYILQRLRVRPGTTVLEAGAGSGSFTHAAARAVFDGATGTGHGHVFSFEFHAPRVHTLQNELTAHGLDDLVTLTHRDVCVSGFHPHTPAPSKPNITSIFLDLPTPWHAIPHLTRSPNGPLHPTAALHLCVFVPCIEQATLTTRNLRHSGWTTITTTELAHRRLDIRRERVGIVREQGLRGVKAVPASVAEAIGRLRDVVSENVRDHPDYDDAPRESTRAARLKRNQFEAAQRKLFKAGRLVHRGEADAKTHTGFLVFAVMPGRRASA